jgi:hypothetical protein
VKAISSVPLALSTSGIAWSPPVLKPAISPPAVSVASTEVSGGELVTYTLSVGDQGGNSSKVSLSFFKPPRSRIPMMLPIGISGAIPVMSNSLQAKPVAM